MPLVEAVVEAKPGRVLEAGCGWGELAEWIRRGTGAEVVAVDLSPHMVDLARERGVDARIADVQELPFEDGEVILSRRFEHVRRVDIDGSLEFADRAAVEEYVRASISMSPFASNLPAVVPEPFYARRASSIFVAEKA